MNPIFILGLADDQNLRQPIADLTSSDIDAIISGEILNTRPLYLVALSPKLLLPNALEAGMYQSLRDLFSRYESATFATPEGWALGSYTFGRGGLVSYVASSNRGPTNVGETFRSIAPTEEFIALNLSLVARNFPELLRYLFSAESAIDFARIIGETRIPGIISPTLTCFEISSRRKRPRAQRKRDENFQIVKPSTPPITLEILTRSKFKDVSKLERNIDSVNEFRARLPEWISIQHRLISDLVPPRLPRFEGVFTQSKLNLNFDNRAQLVKESISSTTADYIWFLDDDDWLSTLAVEDFVRSVYLAMDDHRAILLGASQYVLRADFSGSFAKGHYFSPKRFLESLAFGNQIPISCAIYPTETLKQVDSEVLDRVTYLEDHLLLIMFATIADCSPVELNREMVCIEVSQGNSVLQSDSEGWARSHVEMSSAVATRKAQGIPALWYLSSLKRGEANAPKPTVILRRTLVMFKPATWRAALRFGLLRRIIRSPSPISTFREYFNRLN